jgi:predicted amidophosphoribosyltransferase
MTFDASIRWEPAWLRAVLPSVCPVCDRRGPAPCRACWSALRPAPPAPPPAGVDVCRSLLVYEGAGRELVARLKYRNARSALAWLAAGMAALVARTLGLRPPPLLATWAPTSVERRRQRGFDQAELLARAVARELGIPCVPLLERGPGPPQTGRTGSARRHGPGFAPHRRAPPPGRVRTAVLVVDDVLTTGATLAAAARTLRTLGAPSVMAVTAGRTPLKVRADAADP